MAGFYQRAVFWLGIMVLTQISRLNFKQSRISPLIPHTCVLGSLFYGKCFGVLVIFRYIWRVFIKGLVKFMKVGNYEDLVLNLGCYCGAVNCLLVSNNLFPLLIPLSSLKFLLISGTLNKAASHKPVFCRRTANYLSESNAVKICLAISWRMHQPVFCPDQPR